MADQRSVAVFGATGYIGGNTLDLIRRHPDRFRVSVLTGGGNVGLLARLAQEFEPESVAIADDEKFSDLKEALKDTAVEVHAGPEAIASLAGLGADVSIMAITGMAGLMPALSAAAAGGIVAIANKEAVVTAGKIIREAAVGSGATLLPVDSEHNAVFQVLAGNDPTGVDKVILTASGGPFWEWDMAAMAAATPEQATKHPNWPMGAKISVDSATFMNKGLEVIEAGILFDLPEERIGVVIHRQSLIHCIVCHRDGSMLAHMGDADMRVPISFCLAWPGRLDWQPTCLDVGSLAMLSFEPPDSERFPCLELARQSMRVGGLAPTGLNAANEIAVDAFLTGKIGFLDIAELNRHILETVDHPEAADLPSIMAHDEMARERSLEWLSSGRGRRGL